MGRFDRLPGIDEAESTRRNVVVGSVYALAGCVSIGALAGDSDDDSSGDGGSSGNGSGNGETATNSPTDTATDTNTDTENETDTATETGGVGPVGEMGAVSANTDWLDQRASFESSGQVVTDSFEASRFTTFVFEHSGSSNFIVELIDDNSGDRVDTLVNEIGAVSGATGLGLPDSQYILDVDADGDWSIELGEPFAPDDEFGVPPGSISGSFDDVYGEIEIDGRQTVRGEHDGDGNFQVFVWDEASNSDFPDEIIFNEIGDFSGETSVQLSGLFYIEVVGNGDYSVEIEE